MDSLRVRAYNVRFGDALLVTVPDRGEDGTVTTRHILIDVGNVLIGSGGQDDIFEPVIEDILNELDGEPLDLYVMTHEHMDHVQGLLWAKQERGLEVTATHAWLTASAAPDYYDRFPDAKKKRLALEATYERIALYFRTAASPPSAAVEALLLNNNPRSTADCVAHLRTVGEKTSYVSRATDLDGAHSFEEASFEIWGPEEDTSIYYGRFRPMGLAVDTDAPRELAAAAKAAGGPGSDSRDAAGEPRNPAGESEDPAGEAEDPAGEPRDPAGEAEDGSAVAAPEDRPTAPPLPPPGVDAGAFYNLVDRRRRGIFDNLLKIDKAANDSSLVFVLSWRGWRLLFAGDAEERSWKEMNKRGLPAPVHFLKIGHHGSHNGTPDGELLETILPADPPDDRPRSALVSTHEGTYNNVPDSETLERLEQRCRIERIGEEEDALFVDLFFPDGG